jgi:DNA mismatch repair ATPase MutS
VGERREERSLPWGECLESERKGGRWRTSMADPTFLDAGDPGMGDFDDEAPPACVLALCLQRDKLGLASFDEATGIMSVGQTHASQSSLLDTIESLKMVGSPTLMLISQQMARNEELMHLIESPLLEGGQKFEIQALKPRFWEYDRARNTVTAHLHVKDLYQLKGLPRNETDAFQMLDSVLDWTAKQSIQALGALVSHLQVTTFSMEADRSVMVLRVEEMSWLKRMRVDPVSLRALGIFCEEQHPNVLRGKGRSKEGFSLFSLLDRTRSIPGRKQLRDWMMAPSTDIKVITARQDGVELFLAPENAELCNHIAAQLSRIQDIPRILLRIKRVSVRPVHWLSLASSLEAALAVRDILDVLRQRAHSLASSKFVETIMHGMNPQDLVHASRELSTVIDFEASRIEGDIVIRSGVDDELDRLKSTFAELPSTLQTVGSVLLADYPHVPELSVEYLPQIGFLVAMPYSFDAYAPSDFSLSFRQDQTAFYKCPRTDDLDQTIGDIRAHIADRQQSLMRSLEDNILFREIALQLGAMALAERKLLVLSVTPFSSPSAYLFSRLPSCSRCSHVTGVCRPGFEDGSPSGSGSESHLHRRRPPSVAGIGGGPVHTQRYIPWWCTWDYGSHHWRQLQWQECLLKAGWCPGLPCSHRVLSPMPEGHHWHHGSHFHSHQHH